MPTNVWDPVQDDWLLQSLPSMSCAPGGSMASEERESGGRTLGAANGTISISMDMVDASGEAANRHRHQDVSLSLINFQKLRSISEAACI